MAIDIEDEMLHPGKAFQTVPRWGCVQNRQPWKRSWSHGWQCCKIIISMRKAHKKKPPNMRAFPHVLWTKEKGLFCSHESLMCPHLTGCMPFWSPHLQEDAADWEKGKRRPSRGWSCRFVSRYSKSWDTSVWRGEGSREIRWRHEKHERVEFLLKTCCTRTRGNSLK